MKTKKVQIVLKTTGDVLYEASSLEEAKAWLAIELKENPDIEKNDIEIKS